ncbi:hypothetical protein VPH35_094992 [Triticum aestivum]
MPPNKIQTLLGHDRKGLFSCLYSGNCDELPSFCFKRDLLASIPDLYEEAYDRLPVDDMPAEAADQLITSMGKYGLCLGLMDPVTNIILNTIAHLPPDFRANPPPPHSCKRRRRSKRLAGAARPKDTWPRDAAPSYLALRRFMVRYFGCLSEEQATRYLHWAGADLPLAVLLVEHDLYAAELELPDTASKRTQAALMCAATCASHPAPDALVRLHTTPLPLQRLLATAAFLKPGGPKLTVDDVDTLVDLLRYQGSAHLDLQVKLLPGEREVVVYCRNLKPDEGKLEICNSTSSVDGFDVVSIKVERHGDLFTSLRSDPQDKSRGLVESCSGDACEYTESLRMRLHSAIHAFYLKVFTMLPPSTGLIRDILWAGHCYGPMDPVSNIIVNSIWHNIVYPLPLSEIKEYHIIDTLSMLRVEVRSLEGLITLIPGTSESGCSTRQAMEHLSHKCWSFLASVTPDMLNDLRRLLTTGTNGVIPRESLGQIEYFLRQKVMALDPEPPKVAELCEEAKGTLLRMKVYYNRMKLHFCSRLEQLPQKYAYEHPLEPQYVLSVICGVVAGSESLDRECYHINFVAASKSGIARNQLFFAELNYSYPGISSSRSMPLVDHSRNLLPLTVCLLRFTTSDDLSSRVVRPSSTCMREIPLNMGTMSHAARELHLSPCLVFLVQRHLRLIFTSISMSLGGNLRVHMAKTSKDVTVAFNQESLPPYDFMAMVEVGQLVCRPCTEEQGSLSARCMGREGKVNFALSECVIDCCMKQVCHEYKN